jgi:hypothetical protein
MIGGYLNINKGQRNTIFGQANFVQGTDCSVFGTNNIIDGREILVSGTHNYTKDTSNITNLTDSGIIGHYNKIIGDTNGNFIVGYDNKIDVKSNSGNRAHTFVCGAKNIAEGCAEAIIGGDTNNAKDCEYSLVFGQRNTFNTCTGSLLGGRNNTIRVDANNSFIMGTNTTIEHL